MAEETFSWGPGRYPLDRAGAQSRAVSQALTSALADLKSTWANLAYEINEVSVDMETRHSEVQVSVMFVCTTEEGGGDS